MASNNPSLPSEKWEPVDDLPEDILRSIGGVAVKHSMLELLLSKITYRLVGVDDVVGRLAIREPRPSDRLEMILDIAGRKGITLKSEYIKMLRRDIPEMTSMRDILMHGIFFKHPDKDVFYIRRTKGSWQPPGTSKGKVKAKINPPADILKSENIDDVTRLISEINRTLRLVFSAVCARLPEPSE